MKNRGTYYDWAIVILVLGFLLVMIPLSFVDYQWTMYLHTHRHELLGEFMQRTMFEGSKFGASDPAIILVLLFSYAYFRSNPRKQVTGRWFSRPQLGFVVVTAITTGLGLVHSIKYIIGRARPDLVLDHGYQYTPWYKFGPQFVADGVFYGSFPSGHTAAVFLLITLSYILIFDPTRSGKAKILGWIWGLLTLAYTSLMVVGRCMTLDHWLSDSLGITFLCWIVTHLIYFRILKVPLQVRFITKNNAYPPLPRYWEFSLLWRLLILALCAMTVILGIRAVWLQRIPYLIFAGIPALVILYALGKNLVALHAKFMDCFDPVKQMVDDNDLSKNPP